MTTITRARVKTRHRGIYKREGRYIVWYADSNGKGRTVTLQAGASEKDALTRQAELRGKKARGEKVIPTRMTVAELLDEWFEERKAGLKPKTQSSYEWGITKLKDRLGRRKVSSLTVDDVATLVAALQRDEMKAWSIRGVLKPLSRSCAYAVRKGWLAGNPVRELDRHERPKGDQGKMRILDQAEITKLLAAAKTLRWRALFSMLVFTGLRISEALAVRWSDVDFTAGLITVGESKTEAGEGRRIVLMPSLARVLREHRLASPHSLESDFVFCTHAGRALGQRNTLRELTNTLEGAGVAHATQHELRHTYASILIGQGLDVTFVADQLGHANPQITLRLYAKLFDPARRRDEARAALETSFGGMLASGGAS